MLNATVYVPGPQSLIVKEGMDVVGLKGSKLIIWGGRCELRAGASAEASGGEVTVLEDAYLEANKGTTFRAKAGSGVVAMFGSTGHVEAGAEVIAYPGCNITIERGATVLPPGARVVESTVAPNHDLDTSGVS